MTETRSVPLSWLSQSETRVGARQPRCPACLRGYLHPYRVVIDLRNDAGESYGGVVYLSGWVAVCVGNRDANQAVRELYEQAAAEAAAAGDEGGVDYLAPKDLVDVDACGFSMPMQAHT